MFLGLLLVLRSQDECFWAYFLYYEVETNVLDRHVGATKYVFTLDEELLPFTAVTRRTERNVWHYTVDKQ